MSLTSHVGEPSQGLGLEASREGPTAGSASQLLPL